MSANFGVFINDMVENLTKEFDYSYDTVAVSSKKIEVCVVDLNGITQSFKIKFANRIEWVVNRIWWQTELSEFGYDPKPDVKHEVDTIRVVWNEKKKKLTLYSLFFFKIISKKCLILFPLKIK